MSAGGHRHVQLLGFLVIPPLTGELDPAELEYVIGLEVDLELLRLVVVVVSDDGDVAVVSLGEEPPAFEADDDSLCGDGIGPHLPYAGGLVERDRVKREGGKLVGHGYGHLAGAVGIGHDRARPQDRIAEVLADDGLGELGRRRRSLAAFAHAQGGFGERAHRRRCRVGHGLAHALAHAHAAGVAPPTLPSVIPTRIQRCGTHKAVGRLHADAPRVPVERLLNRLAELRLNVVNAGVHHHQRHLAGDGFARPHVGELHADRGFFARLELIVLAAAEVALVQRGRNLDELVGRRDHNLLDIHQQAVVAKQGGRQAEVRAEFLANVDGHHLRVLLHMDHLREQQVVRLARKEHAAVREAAVDQHPHLLPDFPLVLCRDDLEIVVGVVGLGPGLGGNPEEAGPFHGLAVLFGAHLADDDLHPPGDVRREPQRPSAGLGDLDLLRVNLLDELFLELDGLLAGGVFLDAADSPHPPGLHREPARNALPGGVLRLDVYLHAVARAVNPLRSLGIDEERRVRHLHLALAPDYPARRVGDLRADDELQVQLFVALDGLGLDGDERLAVFVGLCRSGGDQLVKPRPPPRPPAPPPAGVVNVFVVPLPPARPLVPMRVVLLADGELDFGVGDGLAEVVGDLYLDLHVVADAVIRLCRLDGHLELGLLVLFDPEAIALGVVAGVIPAGDGYVEVVQAQRGLILQLEVSLDRSELVGNQLPGVARLALRVAHGDLDFGIRRIGVDAVLVAADDLLEVHGVPGSIDGPLGEAVHLVLLPVAPPRPGVTAPGAEGLVLALLDGHDPVARVSPRHLDVGQAGVVYLAGRVIEQRAPSSRPPVASHGHVRPGCGRAIPGIVGEDQHLVAVGLGCGGDIRQHDQAVSLGGLAVRAGAAGLDYIGAGLFQRDVNRQGGLLFRSGHVLVVLVFARIGRGERPVGGDVALHIRQDGQCIIHALHLADRLREVNRPRLEMKLLYVANLPEDLRRLPRQIALLYLEPDARGLDLADPVAGGLDQVLAAGKVLEDKLVFLDRLDEFVEPHVGFGDLVLCLWGVRRPGELLHAAAKQGDASFRHLPIALPDRMLAGQVKGLALAIGLDLQRDDVLVQLDRLLHVVPALLGRVPGPACRYLLRRLGEDAIVSPQHIGRLEVGVCRLGILVRFFVQLARGHVRFIGVLPRAAPGAVVAHRHPEIGVLLKRLVFAHDLPGVGVPVLFSQLAHAEGLEALGRTQHLALGRRGQGLVGQGQCRLVVMPGVLLACLFAKVFGRRGGDNRRGRKTNDRHHHDRQVPAVTSNGFHVVLLCAQISALSFHNLRRAAALNGSPVEAYYSLKLHERPR